MVLHVLKFNHVLDQNEKQYTNNLCFLSSSHPNKEPIGGNNSFIQSFFIEVHGALMPHYSFYYRNLKLISSPICSLWRSFVPRKSNATNKTFLLFSWCTKKAWMMSLSMYLAQSLMLLLFFLPFLVFEEDRISITPLECASF